MLLDRGYSLRWSMCKQVMTGLASLPSLFCFKLCSKSPSCFFLHSAASGRLHSKDGRWVLLLKYTCELLQASKVTIVNAAVFRNWQVYVCNFLCHSCQRWQGLETALTASSNNGSLKRTFETTAWKSTAQVQALQPQLILSSCTKHWSQESGRCWMSCCINWWVKTSRNRIACESSNGLPLHCNQCFPLQLFSLY